MTAIIRVPRRKSPSKSLEDFFARVDPRRARLIFALDATASRQPTWDQAAVLQAQMFETAAAVGNLSCQLVFFHGYNGECSASQWFDSAKLLGATMNKISCMAGRTQIEKVLRHAAREHAKAPVAALILISDACEESEDALYAAARALSAPVFVFQEGRSDLVAGIYGRIAEITKGAVAQFDSGSAAKMICWVRQADKPSQRKLASLRF
jgi:hypothetical protein